MILPDPAAAIAAVPAGGVWQAEDQATYVTNGVKVTKPITIMGNGATFLNPATTAPAIGGQGLKPLIQVNQTTDVTVEHITLEGGLVSGLGRETRFMVGEAGVDVLSSAHVNLMNVSVNNVWGDGLTLGFTPRKPPSTDVTVSNYSINGTGGIRQGVTLAYVDGITFDNLLISSNSGIDFESDLEGVGAGNVVFNNFSGNGGIRLAGFLAGPVTFNNPRCTGSVSLINAAADSAQQVNIVGGHIFINRQYHGTPPAGIWVARDAVSFPGPGASKLTMTNVAVDRVAGTLPITTGAWSVTGGGILELDGCCITDPQGTNDAASTVTIT